MTAKQRSKITYKAIQKGVRLSSLAELFNCSQQNIRQELIRYGYWNKLENRRLRAEQDLKKLLT